MPARRRFVVVLGTVAALAATGPGCNEGDTVTAPALTATCSATPSSGEAPLVVSFALTIAGAEGTPSVAVSYGDGATGTDPDASHTYGAGGVYTASFTLSTSTGQSARCAATVSVSGDPAPGPSPSPSDNLPPVAEFKTTPDANANDRIVGTAPLDVRFNMCLTADPEGDTLYFTMDLDGDGKLDVRGSTGASCRHDRTYSTMGTWKASNCVTDLDPGGARLHDYQCVTYTVVAN